jgi:hypothetical protein
MVSLYIQLISDGVQGKKGHCHLLYYRKISNNAQDIDYHFCHHIAFPRKGIVRCFREKCASDNDYSLARWANLI